MDYFNVETPKRVDFTKFKNSSDMVKECKDDARLWAQSFVQFADKNNFTVEEDFAAIWFASAIETVREIEINKEKDRKKKEIEDVDKLN